jgi:arylsulfatase A-like enzyme
MAANGMLFRNNCVTTSICWISRATMVTGLYAAVHQQLKINDTQIFNGTVQWKNTMYPMLKNAGYNIGYVGKWFVLSLFFGVCDALALRSDHV